MRAAGTIFGERPVLKLMYAALIRGSERWRGIRITDLERKQLERLREETEERHRKENGPAVKAPGRQVNAQAFSSRNRT